MGRIMLIFRLASRDLRRRPAEAILVLLVIAVSTTTLTVGLVLHGVTSKPYQRTRAATAGPDVVAELVPPAPDSGQSASLANLNALIHAPGVTGHTGPYPVTQAVIRAGGRTSGVIAEGRDPAPATIDQPKLTQGSWVREGGVVVERSFADALGVRAGDQVTLNGRPFRIVGIAVTAAIQSYPQTFDIGWSSHIQPLSQPTPGLIWLTQADARSLAPSTRSLAYLLNLKLANPAEAPAFVTAHSTNAPPSIQPHMYSWQQIRDSDNLTVKNEQQALVTGSSLLGLLAVAGIAVLVGGRLAEQTRRVGLLKAVGGTPGLVAAVLLAEHLVLAVFAATVGLVAGWLAAPLLTSAGAGLVGTAGAPSISVSTVALVAAVALGVAGAATLVPATRAARTSTVSALTDAARPPRRRALLIAISARLPVPLLAAGRPPATP